MTIQIIDAILALDKDAKVVVRGTPSNESEYKDQAKIVSGSDENGSAILSSVLPWTWEQVSAKQAELQAEYDAQEYARNRQSEYPSINDLIVALWENVVEERASAVVSLEADRQAVKAKYPKP
jgi:fatty acid/phospholipid biosynthesis enzyme